MGADLYLTLLTPLSGFRRLWTGRGVAPGTRLNSGHSPRAHRCQRGSRFRLGLHSFPGTARSEMLPAFPGPQTPATEPLHVDLGTDQRRGWNWRAGDGGAGPWKTLRQFTDTENSSDAHFLLSQCPHSPHMPAGPERGCVQLLPRVPLERAGPTPWAQHLGPQKLEFSDWGVRPEGPGGLGAWAVLARGFSAPLWWGSAPTEAQMLLGQAYVGSWGSPRCPPTRTPPIGLHTS